MGLEKHYWKEEDKINNLSSLCEMEDDTTEHVLQWGWRDEDRKQRNNKNNTDAWRDKIVQIFRENKRKWEEKRLKGREVTV